MSEKVPKFLRDGVDYIVDGYLIRAEIYRRDPRTKIKTVVDEYYLTLDMTEDCLYGEHGKVKAAQELREKLTRSDNVVPLKDKDCG